MSLLNATVWSNSSQALKIQICKYMCICIEIHKDIRSKNYKNITIVVLMYIFFVNVTLEETIT